MVTKPASEQSQDFSIHNEDFPALPGSSYKDPTSSNDDNKSVSKASFVSVFKLFMIAVSQNRQWNIFIV